MAVAVAPEPPATPSAKLSLLCRPQAARGLSHGARNGVLFLVVVDMAIKPFS